MSFDRGEPLLRYEMEAGIADGKRRTKGPDDDDFIMRRQAFPRAMTEPIANAINFITDTDGEWTKQLIEDFNEIDDEGPDGDVPVQPAFAQDKSFWMISGIALPLGLVIGLVALLFMNIIDEVIFNKFYPISFFLLAIKSSEILQN